MAEQYRLEMRGVKKTFPGVKALDGVNLRVRPGTVHALMGENGAGKSTLMKCLFGIYKMDEGEVYIDGVKTEIANPDDALKKGLAMVHQELQPIPERSIAENMYLGRYPMKNYGPVKVVDHATMNKEAEKWLRDVKMDFDPRIIGNKILPDGTRKTGIGEFIRKTSLDEFPQFWNVLKGDMSIVGTRPPLPGEVSQYELHHRARLAIKPGITGMWQVSGRSSITDFEEIVNLDTRYIREWSLGLDIKILLRTVYAVLGKKGAV